MLWCSVYWMSYLPNVAQQVACFGVELSQRSNVVLEARGNSTLLVADGNHLKVYTFKGELVASFQDHLQPISALCVVSCLNTRVNTFPVNRLAYNAWVVLTLQDSFRVVTASRDLSLRVLTWRNDPEHGLTLESQYHLLGGSFTRSRYSVISCTNKWCSHALYFDRYFYLFFLCLEDSPTLPVIIPVLWPLRSHWMGRMFWRLIPLISEITKRIQIIWLTHWPDPYLAKDYLALMRQ